MTFKEYFEITRETTNNCIKLCGVIFTTIYAVIAIISGYKNDSFSDSIEIFLICFLLGNGLGLFVWFLAIITAHRQVKATKKFYDSIPKEIKDKFGLRLVARPQNPKYNYLLLEIHAKMSMQPYFFNYERKHVLITIINDFSAIENFQKRMIDIRKKYKKEQIILTGWGLRKKINRNDWKILTDEKVAMILEELKTISNRENLIVLNRE